MYRVFLLKAMWNVSVCMDLKKLLLVNNCFTYPYASMGKIAKIKKNVCGGIR